MFALTRWMMAPALLLGWLVFAGPASAQKAPAAKVEDDARLFSKDAIEKANREIARIKSEIHKDLVVETVPKVDVSDSKDPTEVNKAIDAWAARRFENHRVDGIAIYIIKDPHKIRIAIGQETIRKKLFTPSDREGLNKILVAKLLKEPDAALLEAVKFAHETMAQRAGSTAPVTGNQPAAPAAHDEGIPWLKYVLIGLAVLFVLWIVMAIIRGLSSAGGGGGGGYAPGYGGGGGGGGFMTGFLGGMFGAAAGMWMYNSFFGGHSNSAWAGPSGDASGATTGSEATDVGAGSPDVGGGDYGGDAGGKPDPDWGAGGGGDAGDAGGGGGDWGGGGGGGDWGGGGGGDFGGGGGGGDW